MGACNAANYVSCQPERNRIVNIRYVNDSRFISYVRLLLKGELFGMKFIFDAIPHSLVPFDFKTFIESEQICMTTVTDCHTGKPRYFEKKELGRDYLKILQASVSLPFVAKPVHYQGRFLMDGGISDSVPIHKSMTDGNTKNVVVLTQARHYRKKYSPITKLSYLRYSRFPELCKALERRYAEYNDTMDHISRLEKQNKLFIIQPTSRMNVSRTERNKTNLYAAYDQGYDDASESYADLCLFLDSSG